MPVYTLEIGIILLPSENLEQESKRLSDEAIRGLRSEGLSIPNRPNIPHISLFQMCIEAKDLPELVHALKKRTYSPLPALHFKDTLDDTQENIFWNLKTVPEPLRKMQQDVVELAKGYRSKTYHMKQVSSALSDVSDQERLEVEQYGIFWGLPHSFNPHITLVYSSGPNRKNETGRLVTIQDTISSLRAQVTKGKARVLAIGQLDTEGNVIKILEMIHPLETCLPA